MKLEDMSGHFSNWWGFSFLIAQMFQLFNIASYYYMEVTAANNWLSLFATATEMKAYYALALISTIFYFLVPVSVFVFNCKQMAFASILLATCAFIAQMGLYTSWNIHPWQFGVGWAGAGNGIVATIYMHFNDKVESEDKTMNLSSLFNCIAFFCVNLANAGFTEFDFSNYSTTYDKAYVIIAIIGFAFCGLSMMFSIYECKYLKLSFTGLAFVCDLVAVAMATKGWTVGAFSATGDMLMAFSWITVVFSLAALVLILLEKKGWRERGEAI